MSQNETRFPPSLPPTGIKAKAGRVIGWAVLSAATLAILAFVVGFVMTGDERSYTGPAEVISSDHHKICEVEVRFPDGDTHSYSSRIKSEACAAYAPGSTIQIERGNLQPVNSEG